MANVYGQTKPSFTDQAEHIAINNVFVKGVLSHGWTGSALVPIAVDSSGNVGTSGSGSTIGDGSKTVTTAGTRVALASSTASKYVIITALDSNTGTIWVGGSTVAAGRGRPLLSLQSEKIDIANLSSIFIDATVSGEGVSFVYVA